MAMERLSARVLVAFCLLASASLTLIAQSKQARPFQADFVTHYKLPDGRVVNSNGHYYRNSRGLVREDTGTSGQITDLNARTVTLLNHQLKTAVIYKIPASELIANSEVAKSQGARPEPFARGVVEGHRVSKTRIVSANGAKQEFWTADDLGVIVMRRTEAGNTTTTKTLRNLRTSEPDSSVFDIPKGYTVTSASIDVSALRGRQGGDAQPTGRGRGGLRSPFDNR